ncbi:MAG: hypothetical protein ABIH11_02450 [Candidatus Altiarchaeota archaeon]
MATVTVDTQFRQFRTDAPGTGTERLMGHLQRSAPDVEAQTQLLRDIAKAYDTAGGGTPLTILRHGGTQLNGDQAHIVLAAFMYQNGRHEDAAKVLEDRLTERMIPGDASSPLRMTDPDMIRQYRQNIIKIRMDQARVRAGAGGADTISDCETILGKAMQQASAMTGAMGTAEGDEKYGSMRDAQNLLGCIRFQEGKHMDAVAAFDAALGQHGNVTGSSPADAEGQRLRRNKAAALIKSDNMTHVQEGVEILATIRSEWNTAGTPDAQRSDSGMMNMIYGMAKLKHAGSSPRGANSSTFSDADVDGFIVETENIINARHAGDRTLANTRKDLLKEREKYYDDKDVEVTEVINLTSRELIDGEVLATTSSTRTPGPGPSPPVTTPPGSPPVTTPPSTSTTTPDPRLAPGLAGARARATETVETLLKHDHTYRTLSETSGKDPALATADTAIAAKYRDGLIELYAARDSQMQGDPRVEAALTRARDLFRDCRIHEASPLVNGATGRSRLSGAFTRAMETETELAGHYRLIGGRNSDRKTAAAQARSYHNEAETIMRTQYGADYDAGNAAAIGRRADASDYIFFKAAQAEMHVRCRSQLWTRSHYRAADKALDEAGIAANETTASKGVMLTVTYLAKARAGIEYEQEALLTRKGKFRHLDHAAESANDALTETGNRSNFASEQEQSAMRNHAKDSLIGVIKHLGRESDRLGRSWIPGGRQRVRDAARESVKHVVKACSDDFDAMTAAGHTYSGSDPTYEVDYIFKASLGTLARIERGRGNLYDALQLEHQRGQLDGGANHRPVDDEGIRRAYNSGMQSGNSQDFYRAMLIHTGTSASAASALNAGQVEGQGRLQAETMAGNVSTGGSIDFHERMLLYGIMRSERSEYDRKVSSTKPAILTENTARRDFVNNISAGFTDDTFEVEGGGQVKDLRI